MDRIEMKKKASLGYFDTKANDDTWTRLGSFSKLQVWVDDSMMEEGYLEVDVVDTSVQHGRSPQRVKRVLNITLSIGEDFSNAFHIDMTQLDHRYGGRGIVVVKSGLILLRCKTYRFGHKQSTVNLLLWISIKNYVKYVCLRRLYMIVNVLKHTYSHQLNI